MWDGRRIFVGERCRVQVRKKLQIGYGVENKAGGAKRMSTRSVRDGERSQYAGKK